MVIIEGVLLTVLFFTCGIAGYTDLKKSIIDNRLLLVAGVLEIGLNIVYYVVFAREYWKIFLINFSVMALVSILLYAFSLWAAGDSKLLLVVLLGIPARYYGLSITNGLTPAIFIIVLTFSFAFLYVLGESIVLSIKNKIKPEFKKVGLNFIHSLKQYYCCAVYIAAVNYVMLLAFPHFTSTNAQLLTICNLFLSILIFKYDFFFRRIMIIVMTIVMVTAIVLYHVLRTPTKPSLIVYLYLAVIIAVRPLVERFNYKAIPTHMVKAGMVMSYSTIALFSPSKIQGLPDHTTEDVRSRITEEMAASIKRWETSKYGKEEIVIVRKIPFAIFILLGTLSFILLRIGVR